MAVYRDQLVPDTRYHIEFADCCVQGNLTGRFVKYTDDDDPDYSELQFDFGTLDGHGLQFEPAK